MSQFSVGGLISGLDTNSLVASLMSAARAPVRRLEAAQAAQERQISTWNSIDSRLDALATSLTTMRTTGRLGTVTATSSDDDIVRASATATAQSGTYSFQVTSLAAAQQLSSGGVASATALTGAGHASFTQRLDDIGVDRVAASTMADGTYTLEVTSVGAGSAEVVFDGVTQTVAVGVDGLATVTGAAGGTLTLDLGIGGSFAVGSSSITTVQTDASTTVAGLAAKINEAGGPLRAQLVDLGDGSPTPVRMILTATETGTANEVDPDLSGLPDFSAPFTTLRDAADAVLTLGGLLTVTRSTNTISDVFEGVTLDLRSAAPGTDIEIAVAPDQSSRVAAVKDIVDKVNGVLRDLQAASTYNVAAGRGGALVGSFAARQAVGEIQDSLSTVVGAGDLRLLAQVGITIERDGTFKVDEAKLGNALADDPTAVEQLLFGTAGDLTDGVFDDVASTVERLRGTGGLVENAKQAAEANVEELERTIDGHEDRLVILEQRYMRQFTAMEATLAQLQSQSSYLASAIGALPQTRSR